MIFKRFITLGIFAILVTGLVAFSGVESSDAMGDARWGKPTSTPTLQLPPTPTQASGGGSGTVDYGSLYGDLYVILRDINGVPILDQYGCVQPISVITGEPFQLLTDLEADILCELTEEMTEWVETVDFGRLNLGRAPDAVLFHAFDEAIKSMNSASAMDLDPAGRIMLFIGDEWKTIDAPAENLALYIKLMQEGHWITTDTSPVVRGGPPDGSGPPEGDGPSAEERPVLSAQAIDLLAAIGYENLGDVNNILNNHDMLMAASLLSAAADKTGSMTLDKVIYINSIFGINQLGALSGEVQGITYFDFRNFTYNRQAVYGQERRSMACYPSPGNGFVWVLRPADSTGFLWESACMNILAEVRHFRGDEGSNIRGFVQAADDALQVIEYVHNYRVPEILPDLP